MFAFFSFQYSSAFAIYMITSNLFSLLNTIVINKVVAVSLKKKEEKALQEKYNQRFPGRKLEKDEKKKK
jgi:membrane protein insertase Oxa1/YidC/SpoIIIJ